MAPTFDEEERLREQGYRLVAGIDEAGRGPLAGPVVAAAVILPRERRPSWISLLRDSKQLTPQKRDFIFHCIQRDKISFGVGLATHEDIDGYGIVAATRLAMRLAAEQLSSRPDFLLIDYLTLPEVAIPQRGIIKGDSLSLSIAAASIVAKVARDRLMLQYDRQFPGYGMARHKGYGTREHLRVLRHLGPCPVHRRTFSPVRQLIR